MLNSSSYVNSTFDWAIALGVDYLPPKLLARNLCLHVSGIVVAGEESWLNALAGALPSFKRDRATELHLRLFAGTTCCANHRSLRVYVTRPVPSALNLTMLTNNLLEFDPWATLPSAAAPVSIALWLQAVRLLRFGPTTRSHHHLLHWFGHADWDELDDASLSAFDVPVLGNFSRACEATCNEELLENAALHSLQLLTYRKGAPCLLGCLRAIRQNRAQRLRPSAGFDTDVGAHYSRDAAGLYAYKTLGGMI
jgi:hypothetical protein